jgi:hypothetical protein
VLLVVAITVLTLVLVHRLFVGYPKPEASYDVLAARDVAFLRAAAESFFPADGRMAASGVDVDMPGFADRYVAALPRRQQLLIRALFLLFEQSTLLWPARGVGAFRRFSRLRPEQRERVLRGWSGSRLYLRRMLFSALKAVLVLGYVGHPAVLAELGLTPYEVETPVCEADLLFPAIGQSPESIGLGRDDLTAPSDGTPLAGARGAS